MAVHFLYLICNCAASTFLLLFFFLFIVGNFFLSDGYGAHYFLSNSFCTSYWCLNKMLQKGAFQICFFAGTYLTTRLLTDVWNFYWRQKRILNQALLGLVPLFSACFQTSGMYVKKHNVNSTKQDLLGFLYLEGRPRIVLYSLSSKAGRRSIFFFHFFLKKRGHQEERLKREYNKHDSI